MEAITSYPRMNLKPREALIKNENENKIRKPKFVLLKLVGVQIIAVLTYPVKVANIPRASGKLEIQSNSGSSYYFNAVKCEHLGFYDSEHTQSDTFLPTFHFVSRGENS
jgi:hypothetical protein